MKKEVKLLKGSIGNYFIKELDSNNIIELTSLTTKEKMFLDACYEYNINPKINTFSTTFDSKTIFTIEIEKDNQISKINYSKCINSKEAFDKYCFIETRDFCYTELLGVYYIYLKE